MNLTLSGMERVTGTQSYGADIDDTTVFRYQPGGDLYSSVLSMFGAGGADKIASAASSGSRANLNNQMAELRGAPKDTGSTSTASIFWKQVVSDPLKAPTAALLGQGSSGPGLGGNTTSSIFKGVAVFGAIALALYGLNTAAKFK